MDRCKQERSKHRWTTSSICVTKSWAAAGCAYSVGNHAWEWEPLLAGRTRDGGCILGKGRPSWSCWSGSTTSEDKDTPRPPGMLIANSTPTITIGYSYIWQNEGDMHSFDRSNRICQEFVYGSIGPSIGITASQQTPNVCQNLCKTCMSTFNLLATQYWLYPECWTSKS